MRRSLALSAVLLASTSLSTLRAQVITSLHGRYVLDPLLINPPASSSATATPSTFSVSISTRPGRPTGSPPATGRPSTHPRANGVTASAPLSPITCPRCRPRPIYLIADVSSTRPGPTAPSRFFISRPPEARATSVDVTMSGHRPERSSGVLHRSVRVARRLGIGRVAHAEAAPPPEAVRARSRSSQDRHARTAADPALPA